MAANVVLLTLWVELAVLLQIPFCICDRVQLLCLCLKPVNTTRVNAADINDRVTALKSDRSHNNPNKAGFFEEFEVNCSHRLFRVFFLLFSPTFAAICFYLCMCQFSNVFWLFVKTQRELDQAVHYNASN